MELVTFLSRRYAPPTLQNTEGEPLTMCDATLRVPDPAGLAFWTNALAERATPNDLGELRANQAAQPIARTQQTCLHFPIFVRSLPCVGGALSQARRAPTSR